MRIKIIDLNSKFMYVLTNLIVQFLETETLNNEKMWINLSSEHSTAKPLYIRSVDHMYSILNSLCRQIIMFQCKIHYK